MVSKAVGAGRDQLAG